MKTLLLLRHAKTEPDSASGRDFDRELTERGRAESIRLGEELRKDGIDPGLILCSPARRAVETIAAVGLSALFEPRIYNASTGELLDLIRNTDDSVGSLLLVGHNPGFERLASQLIAGHIDMPTATLLEIELPVDRWSKVGEGDGRLVSSIRAKKLG